MASETDLKSESELPEFPKRADFDTLEEYQESQKKYYETHGLRKSEDFSEDEKKAIVEECTVNLVDPKVLAKKYHTTVTQHKHRLTKTNLFCLHLLSTISPFLCTLTERKNSSI